MKKNGYALDFDILITLYQSHFPYRRRNKYVAETACYKPIYPIVEVLIEEVKKLLNFYFKKESKLLTLS
jgi:hypothetical protein